MSDEQISPGWLQRPSGPGMWVCLPEEGSTFPKPVVIDLTQHDIDRGAPFRCGHVFGPIPALSVQEVR